MMRRAGLRSGLGLCLLLAVAVSTVVLAQPEIELPPLQQPSTTEGDFNDTVAEVHRARGRMAGQYARAAIFYQEAIRHYHTLPALLENMERAQEDYAERVALLTQNAKDAYRAESAAARVGQLALQAVDNADEANQAGFEQEDEARELLEKVRAVMTVQWNERHMHPLYKAGDLIAFSEIKNSQWDTLYVERDSIHSMAKRLLRQQWRISRLRFNIKSELISYGFPLYPEERGAWF